MSLRKAISAIGNQTFTENLGVTNKSTLSDVLDFYYHAPAKRQDTAGVLSLFKSALDDDLELAMKALFYLRDIRGGQGERESFRVCLRWLEANKNPIFKKIISLIPLYGRWDDLIEFYYNSSVVEIVKSQLAMDLRSKSAVSLLGKWMPSGVTSSQKTVGLAYKWMGALGYTPREYRKLLSGLRKKISLVETKLSQNEWGAVDYSKVPSNANKLYHKAFSRHDGERYGKFIADAKAGKVKINSATLYPYDIVNMVRDGKLNTADALWKQLPNYADTDKNALVVVDVSGSMEAKLSNKSQVTCMDVSISLGIYLAQRNKGALHNMFITFTDKPRLITLKDSWDLYDCVCKTKEDVGYNTNVFAVFQTLLAQYKKFKVPLKEQAEAIYIVSDMEFDATGGFTAFERAKHLFANNGYVLPKLVFWNVQNRGKQTPVLFDERGVYLVSGCSPSIFKNTINTNAVTPEEMMKEVLNSERYLGVGDALRA